MSTMQQELFAIPGEKMVSVAFTEEEYQSLVQIHSVYNNSGDGWTMDEIVKAACKLAAFCLSLPVPGHPEWPMPKVKVNPPWTKEELTELTTRYRRSREELSKDLKTRFKAIREEILGRRT